LTVRYAVPDSRRDKVQDVHLRLYEVLGQVVRGVRADAEAGWHETALSVDNLASGTYLLRLQAAEQGVDPRRVTVVK
jgi:hypothetical protein